MEGNNQIPFQILDIDFNREDPNSRVYYNIRAKMTYVRIQVEALFMYDDGDLAFSAVDGEGKVFVGQADMEEGRGKMIYLGTINENGIFVIKLATVPEGEEITSSTHNGYHAHYVVSQMERGIPPLPEDIYRDAPLVTTVWYKARDLKAFTYNFLPN